MNNNHKNADAVLEWCKQQTDIAYKMLMVSFETALKDISNASNLSDVQKAKLERDLVGLFWARKNEIDFVSGLTHGLKIMNKFNEMMGN